MALALYRNIAPFPLTVPSGDMSGQYPATMVVQPNQVFIGNTLDPKLAAKLGTVTLIKAADGFTTVPTYSYQLMAPAAGL